MFKELWPEARTEALRRLIAIPFMSASEIGLELHVSRNAVIGKCKRKGWALPRAGSKNPIIRSGGKKPRVRQARSESNPRRNTPGGDFLPHEAHDETLFLTAPDPSKQCAFLELTSTSCRWPIGDHPNLLYCGSQKKDGSPYCGFHHAGAYVKPSRLSEKDRERRRRWILKQSNKTRHVVDTGISCLLPLEAAE